MTHMPGPTLSLPSDGQNVDECKFVCYQLQCIGTVLVVECLHKGVRVHVLGRWRLD